MSKNNIGAPNPTHKLTYPAAATVTAAAAPDDFFYMISGIFFSASSFFHYFYHCLTQTHFNRINFSKHFKLFFNNTDFILLYNLVVVNVTWLGAKYHTFIKIEIGL